MVALPTVLLQELTNMGLLVIKVGNVISSTWSTLDKHDQYELAIQFSLILSNCTSVWTSFKNFSLQIKTMLV